MKYLQFTIPPSGNARAHHVALYPGVHISTIWHYAKRTGGVYA
ncbi:hypothetical protein SAMN05216516_11135 [Izhakiella capsodis]|uniref:Uncharacterized protein n=1 Tax=Izhakiella capsodis TaxID=1367852 RepID=A0A1I5A8M1_9GAMM|nr:hypothetical protein SAMN05216516_11135 [Izhakiella capsodis]